MMSHPHCDWKLGLRPLGLSCLEVCRATIQLRAKKTLWETNACARPETDRDCIRHTISIRPALIGLMGDRPCPESSIVTT